MLPFTAQTLAEPVFVKRELGCDTGAAKNRRQIRNSLISRQEAVRQVQSSLKCREEGDEKDESRSLGGLWCGRRISAEHREAM